MIDTKNKAAAFLCAIALGAAAFAGCGDDETEFAADKDPLPAKPPQTSATGPASSGAATSGENLFSQNCAVCHGQRGAGGHQGPNLQTSQNTDDAGHVEGRIKNGKGSMPAFGDQLSEQEVEALVDYVAKDLAKSR